MSNKNIGNKELYEMILNPKHGVKLASFSKIVTMTCMITAVIARWLLQNNNQKNRNIAKFDTKKLKRQILEDMYIYNPQHSLCFNENMNIIDGQHLLSALSECPDNTQIPLMIQKNCPDALKGLFDTGRKRTLEHVLQFDGVANPSAVARMINIANSYFNNHRRVGSGDKSSLNERRDYYYENRMEFNNRLDELMEYEEYRRQKFAHRINHAGERVQNYNPNMGWYAGFYLIFSRISHGDAKKFFNQLMTDSVKLHPAVAHLKELIMSGDINGYGTAKRCTAMILVWNSFRSKETYQRAILNNMKDITNGIEAI